MVGAVSSGGTSSGCAARAWAPLYSVVLLPKPEQPARSTSAAGMTRRWKRFIERSLVLFDAARFAQRRGERFVVGRGERRERQADSLRDAAPAGKRPFHRGGVGLEGKVLLQAGGAVVGRDRLRRLAGARRGAQLGHEARRPRGR